MITIEELNSYNEALKLEKEWNGLIKRAGLNLSLDFDFVMSLWEAHLDKKDISLLVARKGGGIVGIYPFFLSRVRVWGILPVMQLSLLTNIFSLYNDFICEGKTGESFQAAMEYMNRHHKTWHIFNFENMSEESIAYRFLDKNPAFKTIKSLAGTCPFLDLKDGFDEYFKKKHHRFRKNCRRKERKIKQLGEVELKEFHGLQDTAFVLEKINEIEKESWKEDAGISIRQDKKQNRFHEIYQPKAALNGNWQVYFLCVNGEYAAFKLHLTHGEKTYSLKTAYKRKYRDYSLGFLGHLFVVKELFIHGQKEYDLLIGETTLKKEFATGFRQVFNFSIYNKGSIYANLIFLSKWISGMAKKLFVVGR